MKTKTIWTCVIITSLVLITPVVVATVMTGTFMPFPQSEFLVFSPYPSDNSFDVTRPPSNLSFNVTGISINVSVYFYNRTSQVDTITLIANWSEIDSQRCIISDLTTLNGTTEFTWGNQNYTWYINATNGTAWVNRTYTYRTYNETLGKNARMDVNDNTFINVQDVSYVIANYSPPYLDGVYDINQNGFINVQDVSYVIAQYT